MISEAEVQETPGGSEPAGPGWFVLNAGDARWKTGHFGAYTRFEGPDEARFTGLGVNIGILEPGQASCMYHGEDEQEDFLVLSGECILLIEGQERRLKAWDFVHCPAWAEHVFVGAGDGPCALLAMSTRQGGDVVYPASELARRHGAGVAVQTRDPDEAYAGIADDVDVPFRDEWLPGPAAKP